MRLAKAARLRGNHIYDDNYGNAAANDNGVYGDDDDQNVKHSFFGKSSLSKSS